MNIPRTMKRRYAFKDKVWTPLTATAVSSVLILVVWAIGVAWPNLGFGTLFAHSIPYVSDIGIFIPPHLWMVYWTVIWYKNQKKWTNPALITRNMRWSIDPDFFSMNFGAWRLFKASAPDPRKGSHDWREAWILIPERHHRRFDKDVHSDTRAMPVRKENFPVEICRWFDRQAIPPDADLYIGFTEPYYRAEKGAGVAPIVRALNSNHALNSLQMLQENVGKVATDATSALGLAVRTPRPPPNRAPLRRDRSKQSAEEDPAAALENE